MNLSSRSPFRICRSDDFPLARLDQQEITL